MLGGAGGRLHSTHTTLRSEQVDLVADFRALKEEGRGGGAQGAAQAEGGQGGVATGRAALPEGIQLVGGEALLEEGDDGAKVRARVRVRVRG